MATPTLNQIEASLEKAYHFLKPYHAEAPVLLTQDVEGRWIIKLYFLEERSELSQDIGYDIITAGEDNDNALQQSIEDKKRSFAAPLFLCSNCAIFGFLHHSAYAASDKLARLTFPYVATYCCCDGSLSVLPTGFCLGGTYSGMPKALVSRVRDIR